MAPEMRTFGFLLCRITCVPKLNAEMTRLRGSRNNATHRGTSTGRFKGQWYESLASLIDLKLSTVSRP